MRGEKVRILLDKGYIVIEVTEDTTVLRAPDGDIVKVSDSGKILRYPLNKL
jgi:hypothetical protein